MISSIVPPLLETQPSPHDTMAQAIARTLATATVEQPEPPIDKYEYAETLRYTQKSQETDSRVKPQGNALP